MKRLWLWLPPAVATAWVVLLGLGALGWFAWWGALMLGYVVATSPALRTITRTRETPQEADYYRIRELERYLGMTLTPLPEGYRSGPRDQLANVRAIVRDSRALAGDHPVAPAGPGALETVSLHPPLTEAQLHADAVDYWSRVPPTSEEIDANVRRIDAKARRLASEETTR